MRYILLLTIFFYSFVLQGCSEKISLPQTERGVFLYNEIISGRYANSFSSPNGPLKLIDLDKIEFTRLQKSLLSEGDRLLKNPISAKSLGSLRSIAMSFYIMNYDEAADFMTTVIKLKDINFELKSMILLYFGNIMKQDRLQLVESFQHDKNESIMLAANISCEKLGGSHCFPDTENKPETEEPAKKEPKKKSKKK